MMSWRIPKQRIWPAIIILILVVDVGVGVRMMAVANDDPTFAVEPDYYAKAVAWDSTTAQAHRNTALGWQLTPELGPVAAGKNSTLTMQLRDRDGAAITGARVSLDAIPVSHAEDVIHSDLPSAANGGYAASLPMNRTGLWELRIDATRGNEHFTADVRLDASSSGDATVVTARPWDADPKRLRAGMRPDSVPPPSGS
jgi:nitrogen fixation protein FixH